MEEKDKKGNFETLLKSSLEEEFSEVSKDIKRPTLSSLKKAEAKQKRGFRSFGKIAAVLVIVLLGANLVLMAGNSTDAYGDKGILHRIYQGASGLFTDTEEPTNPDDVKRTLNITSMDEIDSAKVFFPQLYMPDYLPAGLAFKNVEIQQYVSGDYLATCEFKSKDGRYLYIGYVYTVSEDDMSHVVNEQGKLIDLPDRKIYVVHDKINKEMSAVVYTEKISMELNSNLGRKELIKVAKGLNL